MKKSSNPDEKTNPKKLSNPETSNPEKSSNPHEKTKPWNLKQFNTHREKQTQVRERVIQLVLLPTLLATKRTQKIIISLNFVTLYHTWSVTHMPWPTCLDLATELRCGDASLVRWRRCTCQSTSSATTCTTIWRESPRNSWTWSWRTRWVSG